MNRILDIGEMPARLRVENGLLVAGFPDQDSVSIPFEEVAVLIVSHHQVTYTHAVLARLASSGGVYLACDEKHMPVGMLLPLAGNSVQTMRVTAQAEAGLPLKKQAWKFVVQVKLLNQAWALSLQAGHGHGLKEMAGKVRSGDPENVEGRAARKYWQALFPGGWFRRDPGSGSVNGWLNYGYAVVRAVVGRAVCAAGLHPSLGLHHHNQYDAFCLASDLMEPYRPLVDICVSGLAAAHGRERELDKDLKREMLEFLNQDFFVEGKRRGLFSLAAQSAQTLADLFCGQRNRMFLPLFEGLAGRP